MVCGALSVSRSCTFHDGLWCVPFAIRLATRGDLRGRAASQATQSPPSSPLGVCGTWGPPPGVTPTCNRHGRLLGLHNGPNRGLGRTPVTHVVAPHMATRCAPHSPIAPPGCRGASGRGLWHTTSPSAAWLGLAGPGGRLPVRNLPIWTPGAPGQPPA